MPRPSVSILAAVLVALVLPHPARADAGIDALIAEARRINPEIMAANLAADAAAARIEGAGSLIDPKIKLSMENWGRDNPSYLPKSSTEGTMKKLLVSQDLPFWGKRDLKRGIADAEARRAAFSADQVENQLVAKLKIALAEYRAMEESLKLARRLHDRLGTIVETVRLRYREGEGQQPDVTRVAVEKAAVAAEIARISAKKTLAQSRVNRLLARPSATAMPANSGWRAVPDPSRYDLAALIDRAARDNPDLKAERAAIDGATRSAALADRNWYPDAEVGVGATREDGRVQSYEVMVQFSVPLQWGLHRSEVAAAKSAAAAATNRRDARELEVANSLADAWAELSAAREVEAVIADDQLPQAELGFGAAAKGYEFGRVGITDVLIAEQQLWKSGLDLVAARLQQQARLAEIEALIGDDL